MNGLCRMFFCGERFGFQAVGAPPFRQFPGGAHVLEFFLIKQ
jgi:hypothetical protein